VRSPDADVECGVASTLPDGPVAGFGASDCDCRSHLASFESETEAMEAVQSAHERLE
jgi:endonuclease-3